MMIGIAQKRKTKLAKSIGALVAVALWASMANAGSGSSNKIRNVQISERGGKTIVTIEGSDRPSFTAFKLNSPSRLVIDIADSQVRGVPSVIDSTTGLVDGVAVSQYSVKGVPVSRVMINFAKDAAYRVRVKGNSLVASLSGSPGNSTARKGGAEKTQVAEARAEAAEAKRLHEDAKSELLRLRAENAERRAEADKARREAEEAERNLAKARKENGKSRSREIETAQHKVEKYRKQASRAEELAREERNQRAKLEEKLDSLKGQLDLATNTRAEAEEALGRAEGEANRLKKKAQSYTTSYADAKGEAKRALSAQKSASLAFEKAAAGDRKTLRGILNQRERETVEARRRLSVAEQKRKSTEKGLAKALAGLTKATNQARKTAKAQEKLRTRNERELARAERLRKDAEQAARLAEERAEGARLARIKAEDQVGKIQAEAEQHKTSTERDADARVAEAMARLKKAEAAKESVAEKLAATEALLKKKDITLASARHETQEARRLRRIAEMKSGAPTESRSATAASQTPAAPMIEDIEFVADGDVQRILIKTNSTIEYTTSAGINGNAVVSLKNVRLAPMLERTLDVTDLGGVVGSVSSYRHGDEVRIEVDVDRVATNEIKRKDGLIEWIFSPKNVAKKMEIGPQGTKTRVLAREDSGTYAYPYERTAGYTSASKRSKKKRYSGRHVDLDFKDADIHNILRLLADVGHVNIITADDVKGSVTIRMRDVAWDHALDVILQAKRLGMVREGNLIRVAPIDVLEKEREEEIARRQQKIALEPLETRLIPISYATAEELKPRAADMLTARGKLSVDTRTNVIIARDTRGALNQIEGLIRNLDTQTPQVLIECRIVEATSMYAREIGIQWGGDFTSGSATGNPTGLAFPSSIGLAGGATDNKTPIGGMSTTANGQPNPNFGVNLPATTGTNSGGALGITLGSIANNANLSLRLSAMEETGTLRIISSPKILTLDNREAHIEQGTMIPYSQISAQGIQTAFKEAKLNLTVTPHVTADGSILLSLKVMRDEPDFNNKGARGDPTILKREAETELLVSDGHTAVIGGIFTRNSGSSYKKVPFFADIPILGWLFKKKSDSDRRSEMLIFITPRIVNRAESIGQ
jgi:type IV pilus assembly protein PilQ